MNRAQYKHSHSRLAASIAQKSDLKHPYSIKCVYIVRMLILGTREFLNKNQRQLPWLHPIIAQTYHMKLLPVELNLA